MLLGTVAVASKSQAVSAEVSDELDEETKEKITQVGHHILRILGCCKLVAHANLKVDPPLGLNSVASSASACAIFSLAGPNSSTWHAGRL